ncbi:transglutaminase-like domain-containing protein [Micromonospora sp. NBC_01796]|uniref:transglutaminase-like domain-containing protein n=1 Tax=Micromonospora sp. NBC_01796 TaxID=2975987 RepID=UPI002DD9D781|nr:transglutaminase family protein [Micromonospora sp. NBC_01796]WSA84126.1 transglutaminase family protein [Micromonospora sp. NBC_01796]
MATVARQLRVGCEFRYAAEVETPAVFQVQPSGAAPASVLRQSWDMDPQTPRHGYVDLYDNVCQRLTLPSGTSTVRYDALVSVPDATEDVDLDAAEVPTALLPDEVLAYTLPSRYCLPDVLGDDAWRLFGKEKPGYRRVQAICDHVNDHLRFAYGSSSPTTTAAEAYAAGSGVCRDFAHVAISFCRALSIPTRYAFGYLPDMDVPPDPAPMDFAAWMEVYLDGRWWTFDPRNNTPRKGRVLIGRGRDAVDVAMVTTYGGPTLESMTVWAEEAS